MPSLKQLCTLAEPAFSSHATLTTKADGGATAFNHLSHMMSIGDTWVSPIAGAALWKAKLDWLRDYRAGRLSSIPSPGTRLPRRRASRDIGGFLTMRLKAGAQRPKVKDMHTYALT